MKIQQALFLWLLLTFSMKVEAQIFYQDILPDEVLNTWNAKSIAIDNTATTVPNPAASGVLTIWNEFGSQIDIHAFSNCEVLMNINSPLALSQNENISATGSGTWLQPNYAILNNGLTGYWAGVTNKYLGVRIKKNNQWYYGWIRMDVNTAGTSVTIKDYACNTLPDTSITAGQKTTEISKTDNNYLHSVYPNPSNESVTITTHECMENLIITDVTGKIIYQKQDVKNKIYTLETKEFFNGIYFLHLCTEQSTIVQKLVVRH